MAENVDEAFEEHAQILARMILKEHNQTKRPIETIRAAYFGSADGPMWDRVKVLIEEEMGT